MNYYNPYFMSYTNMSPASTGLFSRLLGGRSFSFSSLLSGAGKVVNFANQAIPLVKQINPVIQNARTMFRVMNEFKKVDSPTETRNEKDQDKEEKKEVVITTSKDVGPTFFL